MSGKYGLKNFLLVFGVVLLVCITGAALWLDAQNDQYQGRAFHHRWEYSVQPATIQDWMTFNYLNAVFKLPPTYLENTLTIQDTHYPDISIRGYARAHGIDAGTFLGEVQDTLKAYAASTTGQ
jgi:hypothetical protein